MTKFDGWKKPLLIGKILICRLTLDRQADISDSRVTFTNEKNTLKRKVSRLLSYQINSWAKHHSSLVLWYPHEDKEEGDGGGEDDEGVGEDVQRQGRNPS